MNGLRYIEVLVVQYSERTEALYAYSNLFREDIIIDKCYGSEDLVGKWIVVGINERNRAREAVKIIDDKFLTRTHNGQVEVKVEIQHDHRVDNNMEIFQNYFFGNVCDPNKLLYDVRDGASYYVWIVRFKADRLNSRWRVSTEQDNIEPFFPENPNSQDQLTKIIGVITGTSKLERNAYLVWSVSRPRSTIVLDYTFCPAMFVLGAWAEMEVDEKHRVQKPINIIKEVHETRVIARLAEFRVDFQHTNRFKQEFEMFHHDYFGAISDSYHIMDLNNFEKGAWYTGWIVYCQNYEANSCWRLAGRQKIEGPFRYRPDHGDKGTYSENFNELGRESRSTERWNGWERTASQSNIQHSDPIIINEYDDEPSMNRHDRFFNDQEANYIPRSNRGFESHDSNYPSSTNNHGRRYSSTDRYDISFARRADDRMNHEEFPDRFQETGFSNNTRHNSFESKARDNTNRRSSILKPDTTGFDSVVNSERGSRPTVKNEYKKSSDVASSNPKAQKFGEIRSNDFPGKFDEGNSRIASDYCIASSTISSERNNIPGSSQALIQKEIRTLSRKLSRICELVKSFTMNESISIAMKLWSIDEYEELMSLVEGNSNTAT
ncbi:hypothetical protein GCK72_014253 [Caenorhabditis remanei]|uniref:Uncharacterized protein n=1 Tax=Caenorhabditis remanei TaxID=31234 RepID=A0A6A5GT84_CAERE|nr:hypothetical protein GCK72_014253 [Caenorhabditis remanei]KAF1757796.1 hypothetical protein GCK72_014253 [Caenorhabditis remanei]